MQEKLSFLAIDPYAIVNYKEPKETYLDKENSVVGWGIKNDYPDYLLSLYNDVGTLRTIINGCVDFTLGNGLEVTGPGSEEIPLLLPKLVHDYWIYGGFCFQIIRNLIKEPSKFVYLDFRNVRSSKSGNLYYYSEDWSKSWGRCKYLTYEAYRPEDENQKTGLVYVKNVFNQTYPTPVYGAKTTIQACEIEKEITAYHYNSIMNGFTAGYAFDFHNGQPTDEVKKENEKMILEKYTGSPNAQRILINYSDDKDHGLDVHKLETEDFGEKYKSLNKKAQQELFSAFRASPNLFGLPQEGLGFNNQEYEQTFKIFNRTLIRPAQKLMVSTFSDFGIEITIKPFSLED